MAAKLEYSTKEKEIIPADEAFKETFRSYYRKQDRITPFRLFVAAPGKPIIHLFSTKDAAAEEFDEFAGLARILMDMNTGGIIKYADK